MMIQIPVAGMMEPQCPSPYENRIQVRHFRAPLSLLQSRSGGFGVGLEMHLSSTSRKQIHISGSNWLTRSIGLRVSGPRDFYLACLYFIFIHCIIICTYLCQGKGFSMDFYFFFNIFINLSSTLNFYVKSKCINGL